LDAEKQMTPARLELPNRIDEVFKFIASGDDHNLAVTTKGEVLGFGNN
jgi:alpha-tubulin suppressor-like RCC1 family protein